MKTPKLLQTLKRYIDAYTTIDLLEQFPLPKGDPSAVAAVDRYVALRAAIINGGKIVTKLPPYDYEFLVKGMAVELQNRVKVLRRYVWVSRGRLATSDGYAFHVIDGYTNLTNGVYALSDEGELVGPVKGVDYPDLNPNITAPVAQYYPLDKMTGSNPYTFYIPVTRVESGTERVTFEARATIEYKGLNGTHLLHRWKLLQRSKQPMEGGAARSIYFIKTDTYTIGIVMLCVPGGVIAK